MRVSIWDTIRRSTSPLVLSRLGAIESISSMKMIAGAFFSAYMGEKRGNVQNVREDKQINAAPNLTTPPLGRRNT